MKITVDNNAKEQRIQSAFQTAISEIKANAAKGNRYTDLYIDKEISAEVRLMLEKEVEGISFCIVRSGHNQYTGAIQHFSGETIGEEKHYKVHLP